MNYCWPKMKQTTILNSLPYTNTKHRHHLKLHISALCSIMPSWLRSWKPESTEEGMLYLLSIQRTYPSSRKHHNWKYTDSYPTGQDETTQLHNKENFCQNWFAGPLGKFLNSSHTPLWCGVKFSQNGIFKIQIMLFFIKRDGGQPQINC